MISAEQEANPAWDAIVEVLDEVHGGARNWIFEGKSGIEAAQHAIRKLAAARAEGGEQQRWISVTERLPDWRAAKEYLIASSTGFVSCLHYDEKGWRQDATIPNDGYWNTFVTHWMELPSGPEGSSK